MAAASSSGAQNLGGYVLNRFFHNLLYHPRFTSLPKGGLRLRLLSVGKERDIQSTKQKTDTTTTVFTKTAGRKKVETESQDSHLGIGYRQADQRSKESKPRRKGKAEKTVFMCN
ncbi:hypothetical protein EV1_005434 [Malus domestica]